MDFTLRPSQTEILRYQGGKLGISAVPGSGKTFVLSALAAQLISETGLARDQEVLVVTFVNSAVDNIAARIAGMVERRGLIPNLGYRVRTLHGLAHDIVREKPSLVGLENRFEIVDDREAEFIRREAVTAWLAGFPRERDDLLAADIDDSQRDWTRRQKLPDDLQKLALAFIASCKNMAITPQELRRKLDAAPARLPLAEMGWWLYDKYQQALHYRGAVDFEDLIAMAYRILQLDSDYVARMQHRFPFILEDESQDSSETQEKMLRLLAGHGNWVRVGDPNQAIYESFTTANPQLLRDFIANEADHKEELSVSGRSQRWIMDLANYLIEWTNNAHPADACRDALSPPYIQAAAPVDPQPNPPEDRESVKLISRKYGPDEEVNAVVASIKKWLPEHQASTVAVLVPTNFRGFKFIDALKKNKIPYVDILASTSKTRAAADALANVLDYLAKPESPAHLAGAYQSWRMAWRDDTSSDEAAASRKTLLQLTSDSLRKIKNVEDYVNPLSAQDLQAGEPADVDESEWQAVQHELSEFRPVIHRYLSAASLPIDQLILTLAQDLFTDAADLALAHKLALVLSNAADNHPDWRLPEFSAELQLIARNVRRFIGFSADDSAFNPDAHRGRVIVTTMHKSKGLEWDRVYVTSVNNYDFPSLQPFDRYMSEQWYVRDGLNLDAEARAQLRAAAASNEYEWYADGAATQAARAEYSRERLRLFYVAITRARRDLIVTWNSGLKGEAQPSLPFEALRGWWESSGPA